MAKRNISTASSSRPRSSANRPTTSGGYYSQDTGYTYSNDYSFDDEESEEEDVFAFVPPSTADQHQEQSILQSPHDPLSSPPQGLHVSFPPSTNGTSIQPATNSSSVLNSLHAVNQRPQIPIDTPPSTDSHGTDDPYRLRRFVTVPPTVHDSEISSRTDSHHQYPSLISSTPSKLTQDNLLVFNPYLPGSSRSNLDEDSRAESIKMGFDFDALKEEEDSPFPEVRASVSNIDDPEMPASTIRMWFLGLTLCIISSGLNMYYNFRQPAPNILPLVLVLIAYPMGKSLAFILPITTYRLPRWLGGIEFSLNPGPWNIKEHVLVYIMANVSVGAPYAINASVVAQVYYKMHYDYWFDMILVLATQLTGFGLAGLCRRFLVWPASMVWPQNLVACTLLNTLHAEEDEDTKGIGRYRFFMWVFYATFLFYFLPGFLFTALSMFSWVCWIAPNNVVINQLFGVYSGLGMGVLTFDWTQISWIGNPLMIPWWAELQIFVGFVLFYWILTPILYYTNCWQLGHFPIASPEPYDRFGQLYNVSRVLTAQDTFDMNAYAQYSPLYLPASYAMTYLLAFTLATCVIVHTLLYHGRSLINGLKRVSIEKDDIHAKLMRNYPEVPDWWYAAVIAIFFSLAIVVVEVWDTGTPVWALVLAVCIPIVYVLPGGFMFAMTGQVMAVNLIVQVVPGSLLSGKPMANMVFKAYSLQTLAGAITFVQDLKLGHYIKVPPRATFMTQFISTLLSCFVQVGVKRWMFSNIHDICTSDQKSSLTCPHNQVFFTSSVVWGLIGPSRQFGTGSMYHPQLYALIVGVFIPIPFWLWQRKYPKSWVQYVSTPIILNGVGYIPPATGINYSSWFAVGFVFQYLVRRRNFSWWSKFNYVTSAALDTGTVLSLIFIFFTLQFPKGGTISVKWWGNSVWLQTADFKHTPIRTGTLPLR